MIKYDQFLENLKRGLSENRIKFSREYFQKYKLNNQRETTLRFQQTKYEKSVKKIISDYYEKKEISFIEDFLENPVAHVLSTLDLNSIPGRSHPLGTSAERRENVLKETPNVDNFWEDVLSHRTPRLTGLDLASRSLDLCWPVSLVEELESVDLDKKIDFCFVGRIFPLANRKSYRGDWFLNWVWENFTDDSYFDACISEQDLDYWPCLGKYDFTKSPKSYTFKSKIRNFDNRYFLPMKESKFVLAPAGDSPWSWRFYEAMMCRAIPIVQHPDHAWKSDLYKQIPFNFYTLEDDFVYREDWVEENFELFLKCCTLFEHLNIKL